MSSLIAENSSFVNSKYPNDPVDLEKGMVSPIGIFGSQITGTFGMMTGGTVVVVDVTKIIVVYL